MIESIRELKLGPRSTRMDHNTCRHRAAKIVVRDDATIIRFLDYPVNLAVRRLIIFLSFRKRSLTEANKVNIGST